MPLQFILKFPGKYDIYQYPIIQNCDVFFRCNCEQRLDDSDAVTKV